ncbi:tyrosine-type recombinase/integrase [Chloroflexota bacterium]
MGKDPLSGKYKSHYETVNGNKKEAEKRLNELIHQLDIGMFVKPGKDTVADYLNRWLKDYAYTNLSPKTAEGYDSIITRHLNPAFGMVVLTHLKPEMIQKYIGDKLSNGRVREKGSLTARTVRHHIVCLHTALQQAVKMGTLYRNPVDGVTIPRAERHEMRTMTESDIHMVLDMARSTPYYTFFYMAIFTGMRRSELLGLKWQDVDLTLHLASVRRSLHTAKGGQVILRQPKTEKSRRMVRLSSSTVAVLKEYLEAQNEFRHSLGCPRLTDGDYVFCHYDGRPLLPNAVSHNWTKFVRKCGLPGIRLHDARHTHASLMLKQGVHPKIVQERLGHSSIQITLDTYSHVAPGLQEAAAEKFDEIMLNGVTNRLPVAGIPIKSSRRP